MPNIPENPIFVLILRYKLKQQTVFLSNCAFFEGANKVSFLVK